MRKEYDFSKGERGKFYQPDVEMNYPVYLDPDVAAFMRDLAEKRGIRSRYHCKCMAEKEHRIGTDCEIEIPTNKRFRLRNRTHALVQRVHGTCRI